MWSLSFRHSSLRLTAAGHIHCEATGHWDCHVEPDWLLLYRVTDTELILVRSGSHAELFE